MSRRPIYHNPTASTSRYTPTSPISNILRFHSSLPNYNPTRLVPLPDLATELGVRAIFVKDESSRFGLPSFKVLGASWGCVRALVSHLHLPSTATFDEISLKARASSTILIAATEGNHGRAVARMAQMLGIQARIFVPRLMDDETRNLIQGEGEGKSVQVVVVAGDYDDAVREAWDTAGQTSNALLIQDTAFDGYEQVPGWIVEGYSTMMTEIESQLSDLGLEGSLMITPVGVGSLAHAVCRHCKSISRELPLAVVTVEPDSAPCLFTSLMAGKVSTVQTSATIMDGMNCGTVSSTAWPDLQRLVDASLIVSCYESHCATQYLSSKSVSAGPCGGASLAALLRLASSKEASALLNKDSVVIILSTEGTREYISPRDVSVDDVTVGLT